MATKGDDWINGASVHADGACVVVRYSDLGGRQVLRLPFFTAETIGEALIRCAAEARENERQAALDAEGLPTMQHLRRRRAKLAGTSALA